MAWGKRREEFDHTSQGSAWEREGVSNGDGYDKAREHASNRTDEDKAGKQPARRLFGL